MIVSARPMMKPFSTGSEMNDATKPSRTSPASRPTTPVTKARPTVSCVKSAPVRDAMSATAAADSAAVAAIGPTTRCLEDPNAAYRTSAGAAFAVRAVLPPERPPPPRSRLLLVDASRPGTRRWCSMDWCGDRAKKRAAGRPVRQGYIE